MGPGGDALRRQHRRRRVRASTRTAASAGSTRPATRSGRTPAFGHDGSVYFGSLDLTSTPLDKPRASQVEARRRSASSPRRRRSAPTGTVYVGSFDGQLHALDPETGAATAGRFTTDDHVYASPALWATAQRSTSPPPTARSTRFDRDGALRWRYDTGDPVRSSPVLGRGADGQRRASSTSAPPTASSTRSTPRTGRRRWSYDTTPRDPVLRDRNDLNALARARPPRASTSAASTAASCYVPYDWCLHHQDPRCDRSPGEAFGPNLTRIAFVTPGGSTRLSGPAGPLPPATALVTRLLVRQVGETVDAALVAPRVTAPFPFTAQLSGDGHFLHITPTGFLAPGRSYAVRIQAGWSGDGRTGSVDDTLRFRTAPRGSQGPAAASAATPSASAAWRFRCRRSCPASTRSGSTPTSCAVGALGASKGKLLLWAVSTKPGTDVTDRRGAFAFPLSGRYRDDSLLLSQSGLTLTFSFGAVPLRRFDLRMQMPADRRARGASLTAEVFCPEVPVYGAGPAGDRPLQRRQRAAEQRHVHHRPLSRPGQPSAEGRAAGEPEARPSLEDRHGATGRRAARREPPHRLHPAHRRGHGRRRGARLPQTNFPKARARLDPRDRPAGAGGHAAAGSHQGIRDYRRLPAGRTGTMSLSFSRYIRPVRLFPLRSLEVPCPKV